MNYPETTDRPGLARVAVSAAGATGLAIVWTHALAAGMRSVLPGAAVPAAALTIAAIAVALTASFARRRAATTSAIVAAASIAACVALEPGAWIAALPLLGIGPGAAVFVGWAARRLPAELDGTLSRRRVLAVVWAVTAVVAVVQVGRLATWITDPQSDWFLSTRHAFWADHECLNAYVHGAELAARGEANVYDAAHYPALDPDAAPETAMTGMIVEDPFQYSPPFLLVPGVAIALTEDYTLIRAVWFALNATLFGAIAVGLATWVGGRVGRGALLGLPFVVSAFPTLHALQYGQFHLLTIAFAVGGMVALSRGRRFFGATLVGVAILAKLFPAVLLVVLACRRRWRDVAAVAVVCALATLATLAWFGPAPFEAFFGYHLPRLASGDAFSFGEAWPEIRAIVIADNQGVYGLVVKLAEMGVPGVSEGVAPAINRVYGLLVLACAAWIGLRRSGSDRAGLVTAWLALLGAASLTSTGAWGDYVPLTAIWLLTFVAARFAGRPAMLAWAIPCAVLQYTLLGTTPILDWWNASILTPISAVAVVLMLVLFGWSLATVRSPVRDAGTDRVRPRGPLEHATADIG